MLQHAYAYVHEEYGLDLFGTSRPRAGSVGLTEPLCHPRLSIIGSGQHAPRRTAGRRTRMGLHDSAGRERAAGAAGRRPPLRSHRLHDPSGQGSR
jgi:hypothetical protein